MNIIATTNIDSDGESLKFSELLEMKNYINGGKALRFGIEHNPTFPPLGQLYNARIERKDNGIYLLVADNFIYDEELIQIEGDEFIKCTHEKSRPFIEVDKIVRKEDELYYDYLDFKSSHHHNKFKSDLKDIDEGLLLGRKKRKSALLDPEATLILGASYIASKFLVPVGKRLLGKIIEDMGDELFEQYKKIKSIIVKCIKVFGKKNGVATIVIQIPSQLIEIELIHKVKLNQIDDFMDSIAPEEIASICERSLKYKELFNGEKIQYMLNDEFEWKFNYLLTKEGGVIGSKKNISKRTKIFRKMIAKGKVGLSYGSRESRITLGNADFKEKSD